MLKRLCVALMLCAGCVVDAPDAQFPLVKPVNRETNAPYLYDDFVYGDSFLDSDGDGESTEFDCNDENHFVNTSAFEVCNGIDDNCDGATDNVGGMFSCPR